MINKVILIGNLGRDPEVKHLEGGSVVARFPIATNENYRDKSGEWQTLTEWHNIVVWRQLAERAEKTLKKGMQIFIEGKLTTRKWQDKDGNDRYTTDVVANTLRILEKSSDGSGSDSFPREEDEVKSYPTDPFMASGKDSEKSESSSGAQSFKEDDDLPF